MNQIESGIVQEHKVNETETTKPSRLDTFLPPTPSALLMRAVTPVVSVLCLSGVPLLREIPLLNRIPGIRGLSDVIEIDLPRDDELRLRAAVNSATAGFFAPNHPEFFTDWMLDKALTARIAPLCGCWATNHIVNGLGPLAQGFWLRNGLIAQVPGAGAQGKAWSVEWALKGHGVLLHPEGDVGWHGDRLAPLFSGVVDMAGQAALQSRNQGLQRPAMIAPVVWKLEFARDVDAALNREIAYVGRRLGLSIGPGDAALRVAHIYDQLLTRDENAAGFVNHGAAAYAERQRQLLEELGNRLISLIKVDAPWSEGATDMQDPASVWGPTLRQAERVVRHDKAGTDRAAAKSLVRTMRRLLRFRPELYPTARLTQEHVAECIKRLRHDYCTGTWRDTINRFVPQPVGPRIAHVRAPEPIDVSAVLGNRDGLDSEQIGTLMATLRARMQSSLDRLARETCQASERTYENPWQ